MLQAQDSNIKDSFGFTVKEKARIKHLRTIHSMLEEYETKFKEKSKKINKTPITNETWEYKFNKFYEKGGTENRASRLQKKRQQNREKIKFQGEIKA